MTPYELLCDLAGCLCATLTPEGAGSPDLCFCGVVPGQEFAHDYVWECEDKCGAAWVRLISAYPAVAAGVHAENQGGCGNVLGMDIEMGIVRCLEMESDGNAPPADSMEAAAGQGVADMLAMRRAIACCESLADVDWSLGIYTATGPRGGIYGGRWTLSVSVT